MPVIARLGAALVLVVVAVAATAYGLRLFAIDRIPDGTLSMGLALALGTSGVMWLLVERRVRRQRQAGSANQ